ncbi:alpha/beta fold hydrolase [Myxococcota bacterium]
MLPGMDGTGRLFEPLSSALSGRLKSTVVAYSKTEPKPYTVLEKEVRARIRSLGNDVVVLGESFSGPIAIRIASNPPPNLAAVVLVATFVRSPVTTFCRPFAQPLLFARPPPRTAIRHFLTGYDVDQHLLDAVHAAVKGITPEVMATRAREILSINVEAEFSAIELPMLFIAAKRDRLVKAKQQRLQALNPRLQWVEIDGPHLILQRAPEKTAEVISGFVGGVSKRP